VIPTIKKPFQKNVLDGKLFTPDYSVEALLEVLEHLHLKVATNALRGAVAKLSPSLLR
jgi:hypothetical protein